MTDNFDSSEDENNQRNATAGSLETSFRVGAFNILNGRVHRGKNKHFFLGPVELDSLLRDIESLDVDVLGLEEVDRHTARTFFADTPNLIARMLDLFVNFRASRRHWGVGQFGNAVASKVKQRDVEVIKLTKLRRGQQRSAILATVDIGDTPVRFAVTHLSSYRDESAIQMREIVDALQGHVGPVVIMGDMNLRSHEALPLFEKHGLQVVDSDATWPSWNPELRIDYIAFRGLRAGNATVHRCRVSDHCALTAELFV